MKRKFKKTMVVATIFTMVSCTGNPVLATSIPKAPTKDANDIVLESPVDPSENSDQKIVDTDTKNTNSKNENQEEKSDLKNTSNLKEDAPNSTNVVSPDTENKNLTDSINTIKSSVNAEKTYYRPEMSYSSCVDAVGWQSSVSEGWVSGASKKTDYIEGIKIDLSQGNGKIRYRTLSDNIGWTDWTNGGDINGSHGNRIELMQVKLDDELEENFDVYYRVCAKDVGWLDWVKNGEIAGMEDKSLPIESYQIKLVDKNSENHIEENTDSKITSCNATVDIDTIAMSTTIENPENVSNVKYVIWSSSLGEASSKSFDAVYNEENNQWTATVNIDQYKYETGEYQIRCNVYAINKDPVSVACTADVPDRKMSANLLEKSNSTYCITLENAPSNVEKIVFIARTGNTKEDIDIKKCQAVKIGKNKYQMYLDLHEYEDKEVFVSAYGCLKGTQDFRSLAKSPLVLGV